MIDVLIVSIALTIGIFAGFALCLTLRRLHSYDGVMKIIREEDKLIYSLELNEDPAIFKSMREVVFKVETSEELEARK